MKHLITCLALGIACAAGAQGTTIHEYPWNPDWNNDNYVGSSNLTGFLAAYGSEFGNPPEPCDYDGTPLEEFVISVLDGTIILDSIFVEYEIEDTGTYFLQGCPETVTDTIVYSGNSMLQPYSFGENVEVTLLSTNIYSNGNLELGLEFDASTGQYHWEFWNNSLAQSGLTSDGFFGGFFSGTNGHTLPLPSEWLLDDAGLVISNWSFGWLTYANYLHILPYWHYAE